MAPPKARGLVARPKADRHTCQKEAKRGCQHQVARVWSRRKYITAANTTGIARKVTEKVSQRSI